MTNSTGPTGPDIWDRVADAVAALRLFGDLDIESATRLLGMWSGNKSLTAAERASILNHFTDAVTTPAGEVIECADRCYGCGTEDLSAGRFRAAPRRVPMLYCRRCAATLAADLSPVREVTR